jgi:predicted GNAT family acetyltransferase
MDVKGQHHEVKDNPVESRFEVSIGGEVAFLEYARRGSAIGLIYLFVPESLHYQGLEEALTKYALACARVNHLQVAPVSPYTAEYVRERREYDDLLAPQHTWLHFLPMSARF